MKQEPYKEQRSGQAMLLAVLALGATMLGATTIAGLLMVYQIRQVTDFQGSAQSVFAADAGAQWALYNFFQQPGQPEVPSSSFSNGAIATVNCYDANTTTLCTATTSLYAIARGSAGGTKRAFLTSFSSAIGTLP